MITFVRTLLDLVRPFGLRRLVFVLLLIVAQAISQILAVFSLLPFLSAAANLQAFRASNVGALLIRLIGEGSDRHIIIATGVLSLTVLIAGNVVTLAAEYVRARYAADLGHWLRIRLIERLLDRRYEYFLHVNSSVLLKNLIEDVNLFAQNIFLPALDICARALIAGLLAASLLLVEPLVFVVAAISVAAYFWLVVRPVRRRAAKTSDAMLLNIRALYFEVYQVLAGIKPILASDQYRYFVDRCTDSSKKLSVELPRPVLFSAIPRSGLEVIVFGGLICWVLLTLLAGGDIVSLMPRVGLIAILAYRLMPSLQMLFAQSMGITSSRQSMEEVQRLLSEQASVSVRSHADGPPEAAATRLEWNDAIRFDHVTFTYQGTETPAIFDATFTIAKGEHVAFVGPTGSGKSTLIDLLLGLLEPTSGQILVDGKALQSSDSARWRRTLGYVPQDLFLYDATISENIAFGQGRDTLDMARVRHVAELAQADFIEKTDTLGYEAQVGERGVRLSGGQRQRLALARALYKAPNVLVLDEATSALDPKTEQNVVKSLADEHDSLTVITVTHRLSTIRNYDRVHFVKNGRIVASGTYAELEKLPIFQEFSQ